MDKEKTGNRTHHPMLFTTFAEIYHKYVQTFPILRPQGDRDISSTRSPTDFPMNGIFPNSIVWNPWHGCHKYSDGCKHCYVYRGDAKRNIDSTVVTQTRSFDLPVRKKRNGEFKIPASTLVYTCFTSDFFVRDADRWRPEIWQMILSRRDLHFFIITKRIERIMECLPAEWGEGFDHVTICCTVENQACAEHRLPIYRSAPIKHKIIICEPLLERIELEKFHIGGWIEQVVAGGESGSEARPCDFSWILELRDICQREHVQFWFKQTGAKFIKDGILYNIKRQFQHSQARKAGIDLE